MCNGIPMCEYFSDPCSFAYGDPHMHTAIPVCKIMHGDRRPNIPYGNISRMHTVSNWKIPVCIQGCANPHTHTEISVHPIPICIRGSSKSSYAYGDCFWSPYAYGDYMTSNSRMHTGILMRCIHVCIRGLILIPVCIRGLHVMRSLYAYGDFHAIPVCIRGFAWSPYAYGDCSWSPYAYGD
jgi:hypothetical protein